MHRRTRPPQIPLPPDPLTEVTQTAGFYLLHDVSLRPKLLSGAKPQTLNSPQSLCERWSGPVPCRWALSCGCEWTGQGQGSPLPGESTSTPELCSIYCPQLNPRSMRCLKTWKQNLAGCEQTSLAVREQNPAPASRNSSSWDAALKTHVGAQCGSLAHQSPSVGWPGALSQVAGPQDRAASSPRRQADSRARPRSVLHAAGICEHWAPTWLTSPEGGSTFTHGDIEVLFIYLSAFSFKSLCPPTLLFVKRSLPPLECVK